MHILELLWLSFRITNIPSINQSIIHTAKTATYAKTLLLSSTFFGLGSGLLSTHLWPEESIIYLDLPGILLGDIIRVHLYHIMPFISTSLVFVASSTLVWLLIGLAAEKLANIVKRS
ncbi:hypothetical protein Pyrde_1830 [Pyrodictium delaneyi]|uniref:Uncharacterized protein n=1 Tax=Pyrodictium delaneyi TaxID=1273541 RepID=A0A0N7JDD3_9CREN|nr:hypothetical protein [Pyrodictium delaneyi]ALL01873.1 hypothetical protein Pyrde_1830 [Pyrodictium delaneyi]OWJ54923.1 hypothetical protein Pdsh_04250 [Pyrodictium delaneyi]